MIRILSIEIGDTKIASAPDVANVYLQASDRDNNNGWFTRGIVELGARGTIRLRTYVYCLMPSGSITP